jgi:hypothetical protein
MVDVTTALQTGLTSIGTGMTGVISDVIPIALGIVGAVLVVKFGVKLFRSLTGRA